MPTLKEFFEPLLEGPQDPTFQPAPEIKPMDPGGEPGMDTMEPAPTQDVAKMSASSLSFFSKNVQSAVSKYSLEEEGFDVGALQSFASALDNMVFQMYNQVQNPSSRQKFEADYQKLAADWATDLTKLFEKTKKLAGHQDLV